VTFDFTSTVYPKGQAPMAADAFTALLTQLRTELHLQPAHEPPLYQGHRSDSVRSGPERDFVPRARLRATARGLP
jgi:hypothetical protein